MRARLRAPCAPGKWAILIGFQLVVGAEPEAGSLPQTDEVVPALPAAQIGRLESYFLAIRRRCRPEAYWESQ